MGPMTQGEKDLKKRGIAFKLGERVARFRAGFLEGFYTVHVKIRYLHDKTYQKGPKWYKKWNDKKYSNSVHRATLIAFIISFVIFQGLQNLFPYLSLVKPREVMAGANSKTWTTQADFQTATTNSNIDFTATSGSVQLAGSAAFSPQGDGHDGALTVSSAFNLNTNTNGVGGRTAADGVIFGSVDSTAASASSIIVNSATTAGLAANDEIIIINLKGTTTDYANVGLYEFKKIQSITNGTPANKSTITLTTTLTNAYNGTTQKIVVQRVPNYTNVTINTNQTLTINAWNGTSGGVMALRVSGTLTNQGSINLDGKGYRGGNGSTSLTDHSSLGEWYGGGLVSSGGEASQYNPCPYTPGVGIQNNPGGGGGGGSLAGYYLSSTVCANAGGAGAIGSAGGGGGDSSDDNNGSFGGSGGHAGYGSVGQGGYTDGNGTGSSGSGTSGGGGAAGVENPFGNYHGGGGGGGGAYGSSNTLNGRAYLGSGGGGGGGSGSVSNYSYFGAGGNGGAGGGHLFLGTNSFINSGTISSNGANGSTGTTYGGSYVGGNGGSGSGGSIIVQTKSISNTLNIVANGGCNGSYCAGGGRTYLMYGTKSGNAFSPNVYEIFAAPYITPGSLGGIAAGNVGLKLDADPSVLGNRALASSLTWNGTTAATGQKILFKVRAGNTQAELDANTCYGPTTLDTGCADWTTAGKFFSQINGQANSGTGIPAAIGAKRYVEVLVRLESSGADTPVLNDVTLSYDTLEAPLNTNLTLYKSDGTTLLKSSAGADIAAGVGSAWTNESALKLTATSLTCGGGTSGQTACAGSSTNRKIQAQAALTTDTAFATPISSIDANTTSSTVDAGVNFTSTATLTGLAPGSAYHLRARTIDNEGRVSGWTNYAADALAFSVEQTAPTISSFTIGGANVTGGYAKSNLVDLSITAADTGGSAVSQMRFSNNGTAWSPWEAYAATKSGWDLTNAAYGGAAGDGAKTAYSQVRDNAGNSAGQWMQTTQADFNGGTLSSIQTTATGEFQLATTAQSTTLRPTGPGLYTQFNDQTPATGQHWDKVDEAVLNIADYVSSWTDATKDLYQIGANNIPAGSAITSVVIYANADTGGTTTYNLGFHDGTGEWWGGQFNGQAGLVNVSLSTNPRTSSAWTLAQINSLQIGAQMVTYDTVYPLNLQQIYAVINYSVPASSGNIISATKDSGAARNYGRISWTADVPAQSGTDALRFQVAANNDNTTWNFIGPDGTAATYFTTSSTQLPAAVNGNRYFRYKSYLQTANLAFGPTVYDVNVEINSGTSGSVTLDTAVPQLATGTLTAPVGAETWGGGTTHAITWDSTKITDSGSGLAVNPITLKYSSDNGGNWIQIAAGLANTGSYSWKLPNITCLNTCKVAILATDLVGNVSAPNGANAASGSFSLTADNTPPVWNPATTLDVSPKYVDGSGNVWTKTNTTLSWDLGASDAESGIDRYQVINEPAGTIRTDNIHATSVSATFTEGASSWYVNAVNGAAFEANTKTALGKTMTINADGTAPTATLSAAPMLGHGYTATNSNLINLSVGAITDTRSGFKDVAFSNDGALWSVYQAGTTYAGWDLSDMLYGGSTTRGNRTIYMKLRDNVGNESAAISATIMYEDTAPTNPTTVTATAGASAASTYSTGVWTGNTAVNVAWSGQTDTAPASGVHHFEVYKSVDNGAYSLLNTANASPYADSGLVDGHNYKYLVKVYDNAGNASNHLVGETAGNVDIADITSPQPPPNFNAVGTDDTHIAVSWNTAPENSTSHSGKAHTYTVDRTVSLGSTEPVGAGSTQTYTGAGTMTQTVTFEQGGAYTAGTDKYSISDTVTAQQWYYYRILATDETAHTSAYTYYKARGNFAPVFNQVDISVAVNNGHTSDTVVPGDIVTIGFKASDPDGRADLNFGTGNASQRLKIDNAVPAAALAYTEATNKVNDGGNANGYIYSYDYTVPANATYGTYTVSINVKDSVAQGNPGDNAHNLLKTVTFKVPPATPTGLTVAAASTTQVTITFTKPTNAGVASYKFYRAESASAVEASTPVTVAVAALTDGGTTYSYVYPNLFSDTNYYFEMKAVDISGNLSGFSTQGNLTTPSPATPVASGVKLVDASSVDTGENRFLLVWNTPVIDPANNTTTTNVSIYVIERAENAGVFVQQTETTNKYYVDLGLSNTTDYTYRIRTKDSYGFLSKTQLSPTKTGRPGAKPFVSIVSEETATSTARVKWTATQEAETQIIYSQNQADLSNPESASKTAGIGGRRAAGAQHDVTITGLTPNTTYWYKIVSRNVLGYANDFTPRPLITKNFAIQHTKSSDVTTTTTTATIRWKTGEVASDSFVEYQMQTNAGPAGSAQTAGSPEMVPVNEFHSVNITGLRSNSRYSYKLRSMDSGKYVVDSGLDYFETKSFDTTQFTITPSSTNIAEQNITATSARIVWNTAIPTTSWVEFSTTTGVYNQSAGDNNYGTTHVVELLNLTPGNTYFYRVKGKDNNDIEYVSQEYKFQALLKPKVTNVSVKDVTPYTATVTWETNVATDSTLDFGKDTTYGNRQGVPESTKAHTMSLKNLDDNTTYHYRVVVRDQFGNESMTPDATFATPMDKEGAKVTGVKIDLLPLGDSDETAQAIVSWQSSKPTTTKIEYDEGILGSKFGKSSIEDTALNNSHTVIVKELTPSTTYRFRIAGKDKRGNVTTSNDYTFVTPTKEKSILQLILKSLEETFSWTKNIGNFFSNMGKKTK